MVALSNYSRKIFSRNLTFLMAFKPITGADIKAKTGMSLNTIYSVKNGKNKGISFNTLDQLAEAIDVPLGWLFEEDFSTLAEKLKKSQPIND